MSRSNAKAAFRELGAELKTKRLARDLKVLDVAARTGWSSSKICRVESGHQELELIDFVWYLGMMDVHHPEVVPLIALARRANQDRGYWLSPHPEGVPDTLSSLLYHETTATTSTTYEPLLVPQYLQTERYARAVIGREEWRSEDEIESSVESRLKRQKILEHSRGTTHFFYLHERALRTVVGRRDVLREQALTLAEAAPNIVVRVVPASAGARAVFGGPFHVFTYREHTPLVYLDGYTSALFADDEDVVRRYDHLIPQLAEVALSAEASRTFLTTTAADLT